MTGTVTVSRTIAASRDRVWQAFTTADGLAAFWGGSHATVPTESVIVEPHPGGRFELLTVSPEGGEYPLTFVYDEVDEPVRLVFTETRMGIVTTVDLADDGEATLVTIRQHEVPDDFLGPEAEEGLGGVLVMLEAHLVP
jgi:uncharacterized protein YndB with AHSA1/START domain